MAGIGFELRRILRKDSYISELKAFAYAALVSSGPWLMTILALAVLGLYRGYGQYEREVFRCTVLYNYAFSLILTGFVQLIATRYLADRMYEKRHDITLSTFLTASVLVLVPSAPFAFCLYALFDLPTAYKLCAAVLYMVISLLWLAMIFLTSIKDYRTIVLAFAAGSLTSVLGAMLLGRYLGMTGSLIGFTLGQSVILFWLLAKLIVEFPPLPAWDRDFIRSYRRYWDLALIGFIYNLAIWADKFVFWLAPDSRLIVEWFKTHDIYEAPVFIAYLSIVPTLALFLVKVETRFYEHYRTYYAKVVEKKDLKSLYREKGLMVAMLRENLREIFILQGVITGLMIVFAPGIVERIRMLPLQIPLLRIALVGAFLQALLHLELIILFYFDLRKLVLAVAVFFLAANTSLSILTVKLGLPYYGFGYCYACFASLLLGYFFLNRAVKDLEFLTFAKQPIA